MFAVYVGGKNYPSAFFLHRDDAEDWVEHIEADSAVISPAAFDTQASVIDGLTKEVQFMHELSDLNTNCLAEVRLLLKLPVDASSVATYQAVIDLQAERDELRNWKEQATPYLIASLDGAAGSSAERLISLLGFSDD